MSNIKTYKGHTVYGADGWYSYINLPGHHLAHTSNGSVPLHRLIAEDYILKRELKPEEVVHHKDFNKANNNINNLMVFNSEESHASYHKVLKYNLDFILKREGGVYECILIHKPNFCVDCGITILSHSIRCKRCAAILFNSKNNRRPNKDDLVEDLKCCNFSEIGKKYGVSDNAVRKWCKFYGLPYQTKVLKEMYSTK